MSEKCDRTGTGYKLEAWSPAFSTDSELWTDWEPWSQTPTPGKVYLHAHRHPHLESGYVTPAEEVRHYIREEMQSIVDDPAIYLMTLVTTDGAKERTFAQYNQIIGSRILQERDAQ